MKKDKTIPANKDRSHWRKSDITPQGEIEVKTYFIKVAERELEETDSKQIFPNHFRKPNPSIYMFLR